MSLLLNRAALDERGRGRLDEVQGAPVTILQIGEGNFLRGFTDWMIQACRNQGLFSGSIAVVQPRPSGRAKIEKLAAQDGMYTLVTQGLENGQEVCRKETIGVFSQAFDPYSEWKRLLELAASPELRIVISNTTEAGLVYRPEKLTGGPIQSYPGKIAYLLYERYKTFLGDPEKGLILLPCELLERNGDVLKAAVLQYSKDWKFPAAFHDWIKQHNRFLSSLVDRIVPGYPEEAQAEAWFHEWGYRDELLCTAEPYHLWAIEAEPELEAILPLRKAGLNVHWTDDLKPFQQQKVRILNGAHTWMAPLGILHDIEHVRAFMEHPEFGAAVRETVWRDILPTLPYGENELKTYADSVFDRFGNPYIRHRLADIAMNSMGKFSVRLMPTLAHYAESGEAIPARLALGLAALLRYYKVTKGSDGEFTGTSLKGIRYVVRDDSNALDRIAGHWQAAGASNADAIGAILADKELWGSSWSGLAESVIVQSEVLERGEGNE
ncbi:tagaturonate reductase [Paenibacillus herberti]|uniref:Altronate oxidoreductase n=1 Tax=Paenibacillus herberti TaxID=1619309 RepID=A0A229NUZ0_9BACL|nr:tagaturonate reductase [Paenibacillus herberti]OXM13640.1 altronate oxidoreductase [Paenibacillus herberti]